MRPPPAGARHAWVLAVTLSLAIPVRAHATGDAQTSLEIEALRESHRRLYEQGQLTRVIELAEREVRLRREMRPPAPLELAGALYDLGTYRSASRALVLA